MTIKEIEQLTGMSRANIRFYEQQGLLNPSREENNYREYSWDDVELLKKIKLFRILHMPLDDVKTLLAGDAELSDVMEQHIAFLEETIGQYKISRDVCTAIRNGKESVTNLDTDRYFGMMKSGEGSEELKLDVIDKDIAPVARGAARWLDMVVYLTIFTAGFMFVLPEDRLNRIELNAGIWLASLLMTIIAEPLMLAALGGTPGKLAMGMRVVHSDGRRLTYKEALSRTLCMIHYGLGFNLFPYNAYRFVKSYEALEQDEPLPWEKHNAVLTESRQRKLLHGVTYVSILAAAVLIVLLTFQYNEYNETKKALPNQGDLTIAEFAENFNGQLEEYGNYKALILDENGAWIINEEWSKYYPDAEENIALKPEFQFNLKGDIVTGVFWEQSVEDIIETPPAHTRDMALSILAFAGAQSDKPLNEKQAMELIQYVSERPNKSYELDMHGVEICCEVKHSGFRTMYTSGQKYLFPDDSGENSYTIKFTMKKSG